MSQPFVVSYKIVGESSSGTAAAQNVRKEIDALRASATQLATGGGFDRLNQLTGPNSAFSGDRAADIAAYGQEMDNLRAKFNPVFAAQQRFATASDEISRAQRLGAISATEAAYALNREQAALTAATTALNQNTAAANDNRIAVVARNEGSQGLNTANVAAQFQDIAVTSAMGMSPLQIALQQGTQLSAVLGGQGLTGVVRTLGAAFASVLSPVSLLTIGAVALGSMAIQALGGIFGEAESATDALERHNDELDLLLVGYDRARDAAQGAFDAAMKLPEGVVASDLQATLREQEEAQIALQQRIEANRKSLSETADFLRQLQEVGSFGAPVEDSAAIRQIEMMRNLAIDTASTRAELDLATTSARNFFNTADDPALKQLADQAYQLARELMGIQAQADSASAALNAIPRDIQIRISMSQEFDSALGDLNDLYQDPRSRFDQMREKATLAADQASATAISYGQAVRAGDDFKRVMDSIDAAEAASKQKSSARGARSAANAAAKPFNQWEKTTENFQEKIAQQQLELQMLGQSTYEIERQRAAQDLLNQAKQAGIPITDAVTAQVNKMSAEYAAATVELERQLEAQQFYKATFSDFFSDFASGLREGQSIWESFGNAASAALDKIADRALSMAADGIFDMLASSFGAGGGSGGGGGNWLGNLISGLFTRNAKGGVYDSPSLSAYSGQVVSSPTIFAFARGAGLMGEAGPEAIMPLQRSATGELGVRMIGGAASPFVFSPVNHITIGANAGVTRNDVEQLLDERDRVLSEQFNTKVMDAMDHPRRAA